MKQKYITPDTLPAPRSAVKGYRKLRKGEKLRATDKFYSTFSNKLYATAYAGYSVCAISVTACHYYRRKSTKRKSN